MEFLFTVIIFAISASITPGPNTIMAMASGLTFGARKSLPLICGICVGFSIMLFLVGIGFGQIFELFPQLTFYLKLVGVIYLFSLAYVIALSSELKKETQFEKPLGFLRGALFQWVNTKAWVVCISAVSTFTSPGNSYFNQMLILTLVFLAVGPLCVGAWVFSGALIKRKLSNDHWMKTVNLALAFLLLLSITPAIKELWLDVLN